MRLESGENYSGTVNKLGPGVDSRRPKILVNNFMSEDSSDRHRSKSVLFSSNETNGSLQDKTVYKRSSSISKADESNVNKPSAKGNVFNGFRSGQRKESDTVLERKDSIRTSTPKTSISGRGSVSSFRRVSVRSNEQRNFSRSSRGRSESMSSDSTDGCGSLLNSYGSTSAWNLFEDHVKSVHVSAELVARKSRISFTSSDTFQKTMTDLYGNPEYGVEPEVPKFKSKVGNISNVASRLMASTRRRRKARSEEAIREVQERPIPSKTVVENARRGWRIIRRHVHEMIAEKKGSSAAFNWNMIRQSMRGLTDMDRARIDMYKRYGVIPTVKPDGTTIQENTMLSEKARAASAKLLANNSGVPRHRASKQTIYSRRAEIGLQRSRAS